MKGYYRTKTALVAKEIEKRLNEVQRDKGGRDGFRVEERAMHRLAVKIARSMDVSEATGTNAIITLEVAGVLQPLVPDDAVRPTEYRYRPRVTDVQPQVPMIVKKADLRSIVQEAVMSAIPDWMADDYNEQKALPPAPVNSADAPKTLDGYVYCDAHATVHEQPHESEVPYDVYDDGVACTAMDWHPLYAYGVDK